MFVSLQSVIFSCSHLNLSRPVHTYNTRGTLKESVDPTTHAIIYISGRRPDPAPGERMTMEPIEVDPVDSSVRLHPRSRINFDKVYTVEDNSAVHPLGTVSRRSIRRLVGYYNDTITNSSSSPGGSRTRGYQSNPAPVNQVQPSHMMVGNLSTSQPYNQNGYLGYNYYGQHPFPNQAPPRQFQHQNQFQGVNASYESSGLYASQAFGNEWYSGHAQSQGYPGQVSDQQYSTGPPNQLYRNQAMDPQYLEQTSNASYLRRGPDAQDEEQVPNEQDPPQGPDEQRLDEVLDDD